MQRCSLTVFAALEAGDSRELTSLIKQLRALVQESPAEEDLLIIDTSLASTGSPRTTAPPLEQQGDRGCLVAVSWKRARGSIARRRNDQAADHIAKHLSKLRALYELYRTSA